MVAAAAGVAVGVTAGVGACAMAETEKSVIASARCFIGWSPYLQIDFVIELERIAQTQFYAAAGIGTKRYPEEW